VVDIYFEVISAAGNSNKFPQNQEKSVEGMVTLGPTAQATLVLFEMKSDSVRLSWQTRCLLLLALLLGERVHIGHKFLVAT
jgi:hypothetical protein